MGSMMDLPAQRTGNYSVLTVSWMHKAAWWVAPSKTYRNHSNLVVGGARPQCTTLPTNILGLEFYVKF